MPQTATMSLYTHAIDADPLAQLVYGAQQPGYLVQVTTTESMRIPTIDPTEDPLIDFIITHVKTHSSILDNHNQSTVHM